MPGRTCALVRNRRQSNVTSHPLCLLDNKVADVLRQHLLAELGHFDGEKAQRLLAYGLVLVAANVFEDLR